MPPSQNPGRISRHVRETVAIAAPICASLLSEMAMGLISTIMLGSLGDRALAAGGLGINLFFTPLLVLQGALSGVGVLAATEIGAGRAERVAAIYWSGVVLAVLLAVPLFALFSHPAPFLLSLGEPEGLTRDVTLYLHTLRWAVPAGIVGVGMMRQFLPAVGLQHVLMWVMPAGVLLHYGLNLLLVRGALGVGGWGLAGSAAATVGTLWAMALGMLSLLHAKRFAAFVRLHRPEWPMIRRLAGLGWPIAMTNAVEAGLFLLTGILAGQFGSAILAAHMIALSVASVSFMVPLAISQAANVRVANACGAGNRLAARRAGFAAIGLAMAFEVCAATLLIAAPLFIVRLYLGPATAGSDATVAMAASLLGVAGLFQVFDGTQAAAVGALRGFQDVRVPMLLASFGYWGVGFVAGWVLAFPLHLGVLGLWWGLAAGLCVVAVALVGRFILGSK